MHAIASLLLLVASVKASIYVTNPVQATTCTGGQSCEVQWTDNGQSPLLSAIGDCTVAVYTGQFIPVQTLPSVNVATASSLTFTPDPASGGNGLYYIVFTSTSTDYTGYSATFTLSGMTGTTPTDGSSTPGPTTTTTTTTSSSSVGSSTSAGSSTPGTSPTDTTTTASTPSGTSTPVASTTTPTDSTSAPGTPTPTPTLTTPTLSTATTSPTTSHTTTTTSSSTSASSSAASATPTSGAGRMGSSISLGGIAALFVLTGALAF